VLHASAIHLHLIALLFHKTNKLWSSSLCSFLYYHVTVSDVQIGHSAPYTWTIRIHAPPQKRGTKFRSQSRKYMPIYNESITALVKHKIIVCLSLYNWTKQQIVVKISEIPDLTKQPFQNPDSRHPLVKNSWSQAPSLLFINFIAWSACPSVCLSNLITVLASLFYFSFFLFVCRLFGDDQLLIPAPRHGGRPMATENTIALFAATSQHQNHHRLLPYKAAVSSATKPRLFASPRVTNSGNSTHIHTHIHGYVTRPLSLLPSNCPPKQRQRSE
jgi:hypothetical protein